MPKVMPVAIRDETGAFIRQMAQGNEAMARMYMQLLARYQERLAAQEFRSGESATNRQHAFDILERREQLYRERKDGSTTPLPDNPLGRGASAHPSRPAPAPAATPATPAPAATPAAPAQPAAPSRSFSPPPSSTPGRSFSHLQGQDAFAQAPRGADHTDFSAQSIVKGAAEPKPEKGQVGTTRPSSSAPRDPQRLPSMPKKVKLAEFQPIKREWIDMMAAEEKKNGLPQGTLLTLYGMENGGGRYFGNDPNKAYGMFQFTKQLRDRYNISPEDAMNPSIMIPLTAANLKYNHERFSKLTNGKKLGSTAEWLPYWTGLHQWGEGDGIRLMAAALQGSGHMLAREVMLSKNADGTPRDRGAILKLNKLDPNVTVADAIRDQSTRGSAYHTTALKIHGDPDTYSAPDTDEPPRPPGTVPPASTSSGGPARVENVGPLSAIRKGPVQYPVKPQVQRLIDEFQQRYPNARITSTYRSPEYNRSVGGARKSQHIQRTAFDFSLGGMPDAQKAEALNFLRARGAVGIGNYGGNSFHVDLRTGSPNVAWGPSRSNDSLHRTPRWFQQIAQDHLGGRAPPAVPAAVMATKATTTTTPPAAPTTTPPTPPAGAQVQAQAPAPRDETSAKAVIAGAMYGFNPKDPRATLRRGNLLEAQQLGPIREAATANEFQPPPQKLGPIRAAATGSEFDSSMSAPMAPMQQAATGSEYDSSLSAPYAPMQPAAEGNEYDSGPPLMLSGNMPSISWQGNPYQQATRQTQEAKLPSWEYPDQPPTTEVAQQAPLPSGDIAANAYTPAISEAKRMMAAQEYPFPDTPVPAAATATDAGDMGAGAAIMPGTQVAPEAPSPPTTPVTPQAVEPTVQDEYSPFNYKARQRRAASAAQFPREVWDSAKKAIFDTPQGQAPQLSPTTQHYVDIVKRNLQPVPDAQVQGLRVGTPPSLPPGGQQAQDTPWLSPSGSNVPPPSELRPSISAERLQQFFDAVKGWNAERSAAANPVKPDVSSTKPNAATSKPAGYQDEPLVLRPRPGSAYVPFQGGVNPQQQQQTPSSVPPMQRRGQTQAPATAGGGRPVMRQVNPDGSVVFVTPNVPPVEPQLEVPVEQ